MDKVEVIEDSGKIIAYLVRDAAGGEGANFITPKESSFQMGVLRHRKGLKIMPHVHKTPKRTIMDFHEMVHLKRGRIKVDFYTADGSFLRSRILESGDSVLFVSGGHGIEVLNDSEMIEVKQGPYLGKGEDKEYIEVGK